MSRQLTRLPRVFCVGWHKTGTSTLGLALIHLGYSVLGCRLDMIHPLRRGEVGAALDIAGNYDALQDVPWAALFRELDHRHPGSRFILTVRDESAWLKSARRHFQDTHIPLHEWLYGKGQLIGNEELYLDRYRKHNQEVKEYFSGRAHDLLVMDLADGDGWASLCGFLGHAVPRQAFPHVNKSPHSFTFEDRVSATIRQSIPGSLRTAIFSIRQFGRDLVGRPDPRDCFNNCRQNRAERKTWPKAGKGNE